MTSFQKTAPAGTWRDSVKSCSKEFGRAAGVVILGVSLCVLGNWAGHAAVSAVRDARERQGAMLDSQRIAVTATHAFNMHICMTNMIGGNFTHFTPDPLGGTQYTAPVIFSRPDDCLRAADSEYASSMDKINRLERMAP